MNSEDTDIRSQISNRLAQRDESALASAEKKAEQPKRSTRRSDSDQPYVRLPEIRVGVIGRGYSGKTAMFKAISANTVGEFFTSGLHIDWGDPQHVAAAIQDTEETQALLEGIGLPATTEVSEDIFYLYEGETALTSLHLREVIGQVLTHAKPNSSEQVQKFYSEYMEHLASTHILWTVIPAPPEDLDARGKRRYQNDLKITAAYLQQGLRKRPADSVTSVALVMSKLDAYYDNIDHAQEELDDQTLLQLFGPIVNTVRTSSRVAEAAIFPVSAFGFGNSALLEETEAQFDTAPSSNSPRFYTDEPAWVLKPGAIQEPYNLTALTCWSVLQGLLNAATEEKREEELEETCRRLLQDFHDTDRWTVPVKTQ